MKRIENVQVINLVVYEHGYIVLALFRILTYLCIFCVFQSN